MRTGSCASKPSTSGRKGRGYCPVGELDLAPITSGADQNPHHVLQNCRGRPSLSIGTEKRFQNLRLGLVATYLLLLPIPLAIAFLKTPAYLGINSGTTPPCIEAKAGLAEHAPPNARRIVADIRDAFEALRAKAVILRIDSPGGSRSNPTRSAPTSRGSVRITAR